jgi:hypothetical protein
MRTRFAVLLFPESEIICCDISQKALQVTTFKTVQEMARRLVALKPSRGLLAELGWNHDLFVPIFRFGILGFFVFITY